MKSAFFFAFLLPMLSLAVVPERATVMAHEGRVKIQFSLPKEESQGSFELRSILENHGFKDVGGQVSTNEELSPLEIYNYLYEDGNYVFTVLLPLDDSDFYCSFNYLQLVSFRGTSARKLWEVLSLQLPKADNEYVERYEWGASNNKNYCYKSRPAEGSPEYSCSINF
jgi:hypothetical protein